MNKTIISGVLLFLILSGCKSDGPEKQTLDQAVRIAVVPALYEEYKIPLRATGLLGTTTQMKLSFKTGGIIRKVHVREGEQVKKGTVLAELDLSEIRAQVNQAKIGMEKAGRDLNRAKNLYMDSVATLEQYQNARSAYELAKSQKQIADFNLLHSKILAPSGGKVQKVIAESNEMIAPGYPVILFASTDNDWVVRSSLTDKDIVRISLGDSALVVMDAFPGIKFKAVVTELGSVADPITGTYEAELLITQSDPRFRTGFISRVLIYPTEMQRSIIIPYEALVNASDRSAYIFIYKDGKVSRRDIRIGEVLDQGIVVMGGVERQELVVTEGAKYLNSDSEVILSESANIETK
jgi:RND family efflux transporter MFP subunit